MKILFESYAYSTDRLRSMLSERYLSHKDRKTSVVNYVGYYFCPRINDSIFILPKVFLYNDNKAFGRWEPEQIIDCSSQVMDDLKAHGEDKVIFELTVWLYQAMVTFRKRNKDSIIIREEYGQNIISNINESSASFIEIVLSLLRFHKNNKDLFTRIAKLNHSQNNKISWTRTIAKKQAVFDDEVPVYPEVVSKSKKINYDEEIIVIFYSVLQYLNRYYSFTAISDERYPLLGKRSFEKLLERGTRKLKSIRYKYFSDKLIALWNLLYIFFDRAEKIKSGKYPEEVFLVKNFNIVFEDMIDDLIGDASIPKYLKDQKDGKQLDHIYRDKSFISTDHIYFIGDSKYYKPDSKVTGQSIDKQYTYAKNVIQYNIDHLKKEKGKQDVRYRDELTEGYNITPNFFIMGNIDNDSTYSNHQLEVINTRPPNYHFKDRLFDRDTLFVHTYKINFLFVLSAYTSSNSAAKDAFRLEARSMFRSQMISFFKIAYEFYEVHPEEPRDISRFIQENFKQLIGKTYRPSDMNESFILAVSNDDKSIVSEIRKKAAVKPYDLE